MLRHHAVADHRPVRGADHRGHRDRSPASSPGFTGGVVDGVDRPGHRPDPVLPQHPDAAGPLRGPGRPDDGHRASPTAQRRLRQRPLHRDRAGHLRLAADRPPHPRPGALDPRARVRRRGHPDGRLAAPDLLQGDPAQPVGAAPGLLHAADAGLRLRRGRAQPTSVSGSRTPPRRWATCSAVRWSTPTPTSSSSSSRRSIIATIVISFNLLGDGAARRARPEIRPLGRSGSTSFPQERSAVPRRDTPSEGEN